ncbi:zinc finger CCHC domain-containing protein 7-like [Cucurbita pepo subsp. pepo]|uniref:zinc finger CCHC domain-containing protein 7-like n=1 Tax=Cucurbita pepo subsp. pepo TaxID=3664 RepID=UPI000C9D714D|nr:zinc finger CCHC domain-containing protein 7-like [Cucurbita pepo subsp. pepo]
MGRRGKQRKFEFEDDEDELQGVKPGDSNSANSVSSDDEANEDLSLNVVEKALRLRAGMLVIDAGNNKDGNCEQDGNGDIVAIGAIELFSSSLEDADAEAGTSGASGDGITAASEGRELESEKTVKQRKTNAKNLGTEESNMVITKGEKFKTTGMIDQGVSVESNSTETTDNNVFRKLLRGPRYFDPPDSWGTCYTCGEEGHNAVNCSSAKRKRSCFVCGSVEHNARSCSKARDCYICKKGGHHAKDCPEKHMDVSSSLKLCLKCRDSGHDMFSCQNLYPDDDLKNIQCYVCKEFGHLCCVDSTSDTTIVSCYKCGQTGHTGLSCSRLCGAVSPSTCYRCREEGHFARECTSATKVGKRSRRLSNPKSMSQIEETNHMGSRSAPHDLAKAHNNEKKINHEDKTLTSLESQDKGSLGIK